MKTVKLGDLVDLRNGSTPLKTKKDFWDSGNIPWFTIDDFRKQGKYIEFTEKHITKLGFQSSSLSMIPKDSILLCCTASVGVTAINKIELTTNQQFNALTVKDERIANPNFIYYWCLFSEEVFKSLGRATTIDYISMSKIRDMEVVLPSRSEQKAIVEKLDAAFAEIDQLEANLETKSRYTNELLNSILGSTFSGDEADTKPNQGVVMKTVKLGEVCNLVGGGTPSKKNAKFYTGSIPWITVRDMKQRWVKSTEFCITEEAIKASATNLIPKNTVVIASRVGLGKVIQTSVPMAINQDLRAFIPKKSEILDSNFLFYWAQSIKDLIIGEGKGATVQGITLPFIQKLDLPLPSLPEQKAIVEKLDAAFAEIDKLREWTKQAKQSFSALRQSILSSVFTEKSDAA